MASTALGAISPVLAGVYDVDDVSVFNTVNVEDYLNTLPHFVPSFDSSSNNPGNGTARLDLRGLGSNRTLILFNGRRFADFGVTGVVDVNALPASLIERVDILTGEGGVQYGGGGTGGVVNFYAKEDFEGLQFDVSHERSAADWDADVFNAAVTLGSGFADGRGRAAFAASYTNRSSVLRGDRGFSAVTLEDPGAGGSALAATGSLAIPGAFITDPAFTNFGLSDDQVAAIDPACAGLECFGFRIDENQVLRGFRNGPLSGDDILDRYNYAAPNHLQLPQERYSLYGTSAYDINDGVAVYAHGLFSNNIIETQLSPSSASPFGGVSINLDNPFLAQQPELLGLIENSAANNGDGTADIFVSKRLTEVGPRRAQFDNSAFQTGIGVRGDVVDNLSFDLYAGFSKSSSSAVLSGGASVSAFADAVFCDGGPTATASGCTAPAANIFGGPGSISPEAAAFIGRTGVVRSDSEMFQTVLNLKWRASSLKSPWSDAGPVFDAGIEYRNVDQARIVDSVVDASFGAFAGFVPQRSIEGGYDVVEFFAGGAAPLVSGAQLARNLSVTGGVRWSDYATSGEALSYEARADWSPVEGVSLHASYQRAHLTPGIAALFAETVNSFPAVIDPCAAGGFGGGDPRLIPQTCTDTGVPADQIGLFFPTPFQVPAITGGNAELTEEDATTFTAGVQFEPAIAPGLTVWADYFRTSIDDSPINVGGRNIVEGCHFEGVAAFCDRIDRGGSLSIQSIDATTINAGEADVPGVDFGLRYTLADLDFGGTALGVVNFDFVATRLLESEFNGPFFLPVIECDGAFGSSCGEPQPTYKHALQINHQIGAFTSRLRWRRIGGVLATASLAERVSDLSDSIGAADYVDVATEFAVRKNVSIEIGVRNITGEAPPVLGTTASEQANTWPATYETLGRQVFAGVSLNF